MTEGDRSAPAGRGGLTILLGVLVVAVLAGAVWWFFFRPEEGASRGFGEYDFLDASRVYYGRATLARRPAVVDSSRVYALIPEYQQILQQGLDSDHPQYHFLMVEASKRFKQAVTAVARAGGYDTVAEVGTVHAKNPAAETPPDVTEDVVASLP